MALVKIKGKYQVTIPAKVREKIALEIGDLLDMAYENGKITLIPKRVVDRYGEGFTYPNRSSAPLRVS